MQTPLPIYIHPMQLVSQPPAKKNYRRVKELEAEADKESAALLIRIARYQEKQSQAKTVKTRIASKASLVERPIRPGEDGYRYMGTERKPAVRRATGSTPLRRDDRIYRDEHGPYKLLYLKKAEHGTVKVDPDQYDALVTKRWSWTLVKGQWICAWYCRKTPCRLDREVARLTGIRQPSTQSPRDPALANDYRPWTLG